jgi:hypothetical protein
MDEGESMSGDLPPMTAYERRQMELEPFEDEIDKEWDDAREAEDEADL